MSQTVRLLIAAAFAAAVTGGVPLSARSADRLPTTVDERLKLLMEQARARAA